MAKWVNETDVIKTTSTLTAGINKETQDWNIYQDETPFLEQAKMDREQKQKRDIGYKKACTIPDIVAIDILTKYHIDVHAPEFMQNSDAVKKVLYIMKTEYPHLMSY